ncbi:mitochondrial fission factor-like isoform X1 [Periophthalmus magnuspinnatus]|uniref:mitochondrial fission factor-like isoform X1 n=1 Tax=Periophthalmus magnuspinnatus TaxID=409849 RepID=UPI0024368FB3|nr:mitochondrial fission factor-like isoform X1 [Periophthalmus magnuspinnatus]
MTLPEARVILFPVLTFNIVFSKSGRMFPMDRSLVSGRDPAFMECISTTMRVPDRLSVGLDQDQNVNQTEAPPVYSMQVPDRLTYAEAADLSPRPQFRTKSKVPALEVCVESPLESPQRDSQQNPIRRTMSDQSFVRSPPETPSHNRALVLPQQQSSSRHPVHRPPVLPQPPPVVAPDPPLTPLSARSIMQMGLQASQRLLQVINSKYRFMREEFPPPPLPQTVLRPETVPGQGQVERSSRRAGETWSAEDEGGAVVELIVLRRQVLKMSRRLASLERHNSERRNTEFVLFCLLGSACLLNAWLWIRR